MIYKSRLDGTEVEISVQPDKKYGILLSGGFDSAVLLYMILKAYPEIDLRAFTIPKEDGAMNYSPKVVDYINQKLNTNIPQPIAVGNLSLHHRVQTHAATHDMVANHGVTLIFNGINKNPPELEPEDGAPDRSLLSAIDARKIYYPFFDLYKTHIVDFMFQLGIEELMNLTHSCTEMPEGRCGKCLQCGQRAWAFSTLVQNDTGTL
jgi:7-cyano-7-deazaguanine synthase in queuosine biosynthesis